MCVCLSVSVFSGRFASKRVICWSGNETRVIGNNVYEESHMIY